MCSWTYSVTCLQIMYYSLTCVQIWLNYMSPITTDTITSTTRISCGVCYMLNCLLVVRTKKLFKALPLWQVKCLSWHLELLVNWVFAPHFIQTDNKETLMSILLSVCEGNPLVTSGFPTQRDSNMENVSIFIVMIALFLWPSFTYGCPHRQITLWKLSQ